MNETQRTRRGHSFLPPADELAKIPPLYGTEHIEAADKQVMLHYFSAAGDWWVTDLGDEDGELTGFGYVRLAAYPEGAEWGYFPLSELEQLNVHHSLVIVERDLFWQPRRFADIREARR
jgi:hypothetical protein